MKRTAIFVFLSFSFLSFISCKSENREPVINEGTIKLAIDESFEPVISEIIRSYKTHYPKTNFLPVILPENKSIKYLFDDSVTLAITGRGFYPEELRVLKANGISYLPAIMGIDAAIIVTNKNYPDSVLSQKFLSEIITGKNLQYKIVVDKPLSSNFNTIVDKLKINIKDVKNIYSVETNKAILDAVKTNTNTIGLLSYNLISDQDDQLAMDFRNSVKLVSVSDSLNSTFYKPNLKNIKEGKYPFSRYIYMHTKSKSWGVENGFIRFSCAKKGQLIVEKMGLVPYYNIPKEFFIEKKDTEKSFFNF
jgi:phosphate transport system substrate-binding protein